MRIDDEAVRLTLLIANDAVCFERHRADFFWTRSTGASWHYRSGFSAAGEPEAKDADKIIKEMVRSRKTFSQHLGQTEARACILLRGSGSARGLLSVYRTEPAFTEHELWILSLAGQLGSSALRQPAGLTFLRSLHLMFLDQRVFSRSASARQILDRYVEKVGFVIHPEHFDDFRDSDAFHDRRSTKFKCRVDAKLLSPNATELAIVSASSSPPFEYTPKILHDCRYVLVEQDTIAARVYQSRRPIRSNSLSKVKKRKEVFPDSVSHISAPILYGEERTQGEINIPQCLGVLSCETSEPNAYSADSLAALSLLAAHAAWPVGRASIQLESDRITSERRTIHEASLELQRCKDSEQVFQILQTAFQTLNYKRGIFCAVDWENELVCGFRSWGDDKMRALCDITKRHLRRDPRDCQSLAVNTRDHVLVRDPERDTKAHRNAISVGDLKHFAVIPFISPHQYVTHTVHVERADECPISESSDIPLLKVLIQRGVDSLIRITTDQAYNRWITNCLTDMYPDESTLLESLAEATCDAGVAARCRIYPAIRSQSWSPAQFGSSPVAGFANEVFAHDIRAASRLEMLRKAQRPLVFSTTTDDAGVIRAQQDHSTNRFGRDRVSQWMVAPIMNSDGTLIATMEYDHYGRADDRFTPIELQWIAATSRSASFLMDTLSVRQLNSELAREGLAADVLRHAVSDIVTLAIEQLDDGENLKRVYTEARVSLDVMRDLASKDRQPNSIESEIRLVEKLVRPFLKAGRLTIRLSGVAKSVPTANQQSQAGSAPFPWILLKLMTNAVSALNRSERSQFKGDLTATVSVSRVEGGRAAVRVSNTGIAIPRQLVKSFEVAPKQMHNASGEGRGIAYARLLAQQSGWTLSLVADPKATCVEVILPVS